MKTENEIIAAHKQTIEVFTGKVCEIKLFDRNEFLLQGSTMPAILLAVERYNTSSYSILSDCSEGDTVKFRRVFYLLAHKAGHSANKIGSFLSKNTHTGALYNIRQGKRQLKTDKGFCALYTSILKDIVSTKTNFKTVSD